MGDEVSRKLDLIEYFSLVFKLRRMLVDDMNESMKNVDRVAEIRSLNGLSTNYWQIEQNNSIGLKVIDNIPVTLYTPLGGLMIFHRPILLKNYNFFERGIVEFEFVEEDKFSKIIAIKSIKNSKQKFSKVIFKRNNMYISEIASILAYVEICKILQKKE